MHEVIQRFHEDSEAYYESPEYREKIERLKSILAPVRDKRIGWDLEGGFFCSGMIVWG